MSDAFADGKTHVTRSAASVPQKDLLWSNVRNAFQTFKLPLREKAMQCITMYSNAHWHAVLTVNHGKYSYSERNDPINSADDLD